MTTYTIIMNTEKHVTTDYTATLQSQVDRKQDTTSNNVERYK